MIEESFPRGGHLKSPSSKTNQRTSVETDLFKISSQSLQISKKKTKPTTVQLSGKSSKKKHGSDTPIIERLTQNLIVADMLILCRVKEIREYSLLVALPNNLTGTIAITNISPAYTEKLKQIASNDGDELEVATLNELFETGQLLCCRVKEVVIKGYNRKTVSLTIEPAIINRELDLGNVTKETPLHGSVSSVEDHGYTLDLGLVNFQAFLSNDAAGFISKNQTGNSLAIGQSVTCYLKKVGIAAIKSGGQRVLNVMLRDSLTRLPDGSNYSKANLLPGTIVSGEVISSHDYGIFVKYMGKFRGSVHRHHLSTEPSKFTKDQPINLCILYHQPLSLTTALSCLPHLVDSSSTKADHFKALQIGDIIENARTIYVDKKFGVLLRLVDDVNGYLPLKYASDGAEQNVLKIFQGADNVKCRVLDFDMINNVAIVSTKKSVLERTILRLSDCKPGNVVECKIQGFHTGGMLVQAGGHIKGFIPIIHNSNIPLKVPEKKYKVDDIIQCRIIEVDRLKGKLVLTAKKNLVNTKFPIITSFDQMKKNLVTEGLIVLIQDAGLIVAFYDGMKGFVPKSEVGVDDTNLLKNLFYLGQVVKCRILSWDIDTQRTRLSLRLEGQAPIGAKQLKKQCALETIQLHCCIVTNVIEDRLEVKVGDVSGIIPAMHLSDHVIICKYLLQTYKIGDIFENAVLFKRGTTPVFSVKPSLIQALKNESLPANINDLLAGSTHAGVVRNAADFGLFVDLSSSLRALAANKFITDHFVPEPYTLFQRGQSVLYNVKDVDESRNRVSVSLRMADCYHGNTEETVQQLSQFLEERDRVWKHYAKNGDNVTKKLLSYKIGTIVEVQIASLNDHGAVGTVKDTKIQAICTIYHMTGATIKVGEIRRAAVMDIDLDTKCLEVSVAKKCVKSIGKRQDTPSNRVREEATTDAQVLLVRPEFVLIGLRGRAEFKLAYAPAQKCLNDITGSHLFEPGFVDRVTVKNVGEHIVCIWKSFETEWSKKLYSAPTKVERHQLDIGSKVRAVVKNVLPFQLNVRIGSTTGRILAGEIEPSGTEIGCPLTERYEVGEEITTVVIGFRDPKTQKSLESLSKKSTSTPECSLLNRRLQEGDYSVIDFEVGDEIPSFYRDCTDSNLWMKLSYPLSGKVYLLNASDNVEILANPDGHFRSGGYYPALVLKKETDYVELSLVGGEQEIQAGHVVNGCILSVKPDKIIVRLPGNVKGYVTLTEISDSYVDKLPFQFKCGQFVRCYILSHKEKVDVSLRQSRILQYPVKPKPKDKVIEIMSDLSPLEIIHGFVKKCAQNLITITLGRGIDGYVDMEHFSDYFIPRVKSVFHKSCLVTVKILEMGDRIKLSMRGSDTGVCEIVPERYRGRRAEGKRKLSESDSESPVPSRKRKLSGSKKPDLESDSDGSSVTEDELAFSRPESAQEFAVPFPPKTKLLKKRVDKNLNIAVQYDYINTEVLHKRKPRDRATSESSSVDGEAAYETNDQTRKRKPRDHKSSESDDSGPQRKRKESVSESEINASPKSTKIMPMIEESEDVVVSRLHVDGGFSWAPEFSLPSIAQKNDSSDDEDATANKEGAKLDKRLEEKKLRELENRLLDSNRVPETEDEFDRLVVQTPDNSMIWMQFMAFYLKMAEIDKARKVAERALKTISFREEQEKLNVWVALMNLENTYGTAEQLKEIFNRAVQMNDSMKVHQQLVKIYETTGKPEQAERLYNTMARLFARYKDVWIGFGAFHFAQGRFDSARKILERCLKTLDKRDHMEVVTKFGRFEFEHGQTEQAIVLFEEVLAECPRRIDVWSVFIDLLLKFSTHEKVRKTFNRIVLLRIPAKKMKSMFKKWLEFEKKFGDDERVEDVKERAEKFVQNATDD